MNHNTYRQQHHHHHHTDDGGSEHQIVDNDDPSMNNNHVSQQQSTLTENRNYVMNGGSHHHHHPTHEQQQQQPERSIHSQRSVRFSDEIDDRNLHHRSSNNTEPQQQPEALPTSSNFTVKEDERTTATSCLSTIGASIQKVRDFAGYCVDHPTTQWIVIFLIASNAIMMGLATFDFVKESEPIETAFQMADMIFLILFTIELGFQFVHHGHKLFCDAWLIFDLVIVVSSWLFAEWQIIRALRIFRALRLITRIKVMQNLVVALFGVMPRMFAIWLLLCLVSYIFAVMFTQLFKDLYDMGATGENDYFGRMDKTFFTLFQIMTLDAWADIARDVMEVYPWAWLPIVAYVIITGFVVVNLVIAVICDAVSALQDDDKAKLTGKAVPSHLAAAAGGGHPTTSGHNNIIAPPPPPPMNVRDQLSALEQHVDDLSQRQVITIQAVLRLTQQLAQANERLAKEQQAKQTGEEKER